ncbi:type VI secretion system protein TssA [Caballeronia sp. GACF4]|uniref:type VI secretion system protein TssA n=1 Tax=Caballeronia sp. GACF4 TaxID=2921763 RepID=UPI0020286621|nr:type VI secretion system protein TssA [Caballeronia sp. GACF4]
MFAGLFKTLFPSRDAAQFARARLDTWEAWLAPLPGDAGVGRDPGYEDAFFSLKDEAGKLSGIDDSLIVRSCEQITKEVGKDLRVAGHYAFARLRQDGPEGFVDGLELAAAMIDRFGDAILPLRPEARKGALEMLATTRTLDLLDSRDAFDPGDVERAVAALDAIVGKTLTWPEAARPNLQMLASRFQRKDDGIQSAEPSTTAPIPSAPALAGSAPIASQRELLDQARTMAAWLRDQENGYLPSARLVRSIRWDTLHEVPPADAGARTRLAAPRGELRQQFKRLVLQKQWNELLERVEAAFMEGVNHLWFDLQHFQHVALDNVGTPYDAWRDLLRADFALFLERLPGIERLAFTDGTPFADDVTLEWIARHAVVRDLDAGESIAALPVSANAAEGAAGDWPEIEAQARDLFARDGIEAAFIWLDALPGMKTDKHRYLQRLMMARLAEQAGRADTALSLLAELDAATRTLPLARWEPALAFEVKQQLMRALKTMSVRKDADKTTLTNRIGELRSELIVLDPARALTLS